MTKFQTKMRISMPVQNTAVIGGLSVRIGKRVWSVKSLGDASAWFCAARDDFGEGASNTPIPLLCRDGVPFVYLLQQKMLESSTERVVIARQGQPHLLPAFGLRRQK